MTILSIDPGPTESAWVLWQPDPPRVLGHAIEENPTLRNRLRNPYTRNPYAAADHFASTDMVALECMVSSRGMPVGAETLTTMRWVGIFEGAWMQDRWDASLCQLVSRDKVKLHLCGRMQARDSNIRQALIDRFGAPGTKAKPGILHGLRADEWQALAVGVYVADALQARGAVALETIGETEA
jgi:hypothetical protein